MAYLAKAYRTSPRARAIRYKASSSERATSYKPFVDHPYANEGAHLGIHNRGVAELRLGLAQAPLYVGLEDYNREVFWHCFVATLGDGIMVMLIVAAGGPTLRRSDWFLEPGLSGYVVMITAGLLLAILVGWVAVHILGRWKYTERMPQLFDIGLVPIAQMVTLPPAIFRLATFVKQRDDQVFYDARRTRKISISSENNAELFS